jgi:hypothetical protein
LRFSQTLLASLFTTFLLSCAATNPTIKIPGEKTRVFSGTLAYYDNYSGAIIVGNDRRRQKEFSLADTARILQDDRPTALHDIDLNRGISVCYTKKNGRLIALRVEKETAPFAIEIAR